MEANCDGGVFRSSGRRGADGSVIVVASNAVASGKFFDKNTVSNILGEGDLFAERAGSFGGALDELGKRSACTHIVTVIGIVGVTCGIL